MRAIPGVAAHVFFGCISFRNWSYPILLPIGLAVIIALVLEPIVDIFQKNGVPRARATLEDCLLADICFLLFWVFLSRPLIDEAGRLSHNLPGLINDSTDKLDTSID